MNVEAHMPCPQCHNAEEETGWGFLLGVMGTLAHYRCRACGWDFSHNVDDVSYEEDEVEVEEHDPFHGRDGEADADALASAGWGTDEDYNGYCYNDD